MRSGGVVLALALLAVSLAAPIRLAALAQGKPVRLATFAQGKPVRLATFAQGKQVELPAFEVAFIKENTSGSENFGFTPRPGSCLVDN